jgi:Putative beta-barrel porin-2, OmpL-like. bbp2
MKKKLSVIAVLATLSAGAYAADAPAPTLSQVLDASGISLTGYLDMAYSSMDTTGLFVGATGPVVGGMAGNSRIFDTQGAVAGKNYSGFTLHQAAFTLAKQPKEGVGGVVNVTAGEDAPTIASNGLSTTNADLTQAYVSYATGGLTVIGGKFATLAGAELITSPSNSEYSRAWMFGWGPYTHTGVRATYVINDKVSVIAGVNNGFDQVYATTGTRTTELSLVLAPVSMFTLAVTNYHGKENATLAGTRNYTDVLATLNATDKLNFVADYANATQDGATLATGAIGKAKWKALALYANYQLTDAWKLSYRHEGFNDPDGYRSGIAQNLKSNTVDVGYQVAKALTLRLEARWDNSNVASFQKADGTGTNNQTSYALESIYQF